MTKQFFTDRLPEGCGVRRDSATGCLVPLESPDGIGHSHPLKMTHYLDHNRRAIEWPDDWPEPMSGANAAPLAGRLKYEALKRDIQKRGLQEKILFTPDGRISAGRNRYRVLRDLGWTHDEIMAKAVIIREANDNDTVLSNILRVNRTNAGLVASYLLANPKLLTGLEKNRTSKAHGLEMVAKILHVNILRKDSSFTKDDMEKLVCDDAPTTALAGMNAISARISQSLKLVGR
jgi:hypothetical protein